MEELHIKQLDGRRQHEGSKAARQASEDRIVWEEERVVEEVLAPLATSQECSTFLKR
jgi:hypothetical protein